MIKRSILFLLFAAMTTAGLRAEFQEIDLTIFGMD